MHARPATGRRAEDIAVERLVASGLRIVHRNWRRPEGEIDIVADDAGTCVFVEVRSRTGGERGHPLESVTPRKQAQIIRTARLFLDQEPTRASGFRFDVIGIVFADDGDVTECVHVRDAFQADG